MTRAIIFDCFGVLATDGWLPFKQEYFGSDQHLFDRATELNKQGDAGLLSYDGFVTAVADMAGVSPDEAHRRFDDNVPDEQLFDYIKTDLKPSYKVGLLSNAGDNWLDEIFTPEQNGLFDAVVLSYAVGVIKPDPQAYTLIAKRLGIEVGDCIFVDDQERYCVGARAIGMQAICYKDFAQFRAELSKILEESGGA